MKWHFDHILWILLLSGLTLSCFKLSAQSQVRWWNKIQASKAPDSILLCPPSSQIVVDAEGNITLLSEDRTQLYKYLAISQYDSSIVLGGKGGSAEAFLQAQKIAVFNRQQLYLLDGAQSRILLFNTNLKLLRSINFFPFSAPNLALELENTELLPISFSINPLGELFILNQFDHRVYKFNDRGEFDLHFGGTDYGQGSLNQPLDLQAHTDQRIYVADTLDQEIKVYDNYGLYLQSLQKAPEPWKSFFCFGQYVIYFDSQYLQLQYLPTQSIYKLPLQLDSPLIDVYFTKDFIYLLVEKGVYLYQIAP